MNIIESRRIISTLDNPKKNARKRISDITRNNDVKKKILSLKTIE